MPETNDSRNEGETSPPESIPAFIKAYVDQEIEKAKETEIAAQKNKKFRNSWRSASPITKGTFLLTAGIAIATIAYSIVAIFQLHAATGQLGEMKTTTKASREAAYAACISAQLARNTLQEIRSGSGDTHNLSVSSVTQAITSSRSESAQLRFNLLNFFRANGTTTKNGGGLVFGEYFSISNVGRTAARNIKGKIQIEIMDKGKEPDFRYPSPFKISTGQMDSVETPEKQVIWVQDSAGRPHFFSDQELSDVQKMEEKVTFTYGRMTYFDVFGISHWIQVCRMMVPETTNTLIVARPREPKCAAYNKADTNQVLPSPKLEIPPPSELPTEIVCKNPA